MEDSWHEKDKEEFLYGFKKSKEDWFMHTSPLNIKNPIGSFFY